MSQPIWCDNWWESELHFFYGDANMSDGHIIIRSKHSSRRIHHLYSIVFFFILLLLLSIIDMGRFVWGFGIWSSMPVCGCVRFTFSGSRPIAADSASRPIPGNRPQSQPSVRKLSTNIFRPIGARSEKNWWKKGENFFCLLLTRFCDSTDKLSQF